MYDDYALTCDSFRADTALATRSPTKIAHAVKRDGPSRPPALACCSSLSPFDDSNQSLLDRTTRRSVPLPAGLLHRGEAAAAWKRVAARWTATWSESGLKGRFGSRPEVVDDRPPIEQARPGDDCGPSKGNGGHSGAYPWLL